MSDDLDILILERELSRTRFQAHMFAARMRHWLECSFFFQEVGR